MRLHLVGRDQHQQRDDRQRGRDRRQDGISEWIVDLVPHLRVPWAFPRGIPLAADVIATRARHKHEWGEDRAAALLSPRGLPDCH